jgi:Tol biopolymer transport system component
MTSRVSSAALVAATLAFGASLTARQSPTPPAAQRTSATPPAPFSADVRWRRAVDAWDAGRYPDALNDLAAIMKSSAAADYLDRAGLLTGELFVTTELTTDGRNPRLSSTGVFASYEAGPPAATVTRVVRADTGSPKAVAELAGVGAAFDATSTHVLYLKPAQTAEWTSATAALEAAGTAQERTAAQAPVNFILGKGDLVVRDLTTGAERVVATGGLLKTAPMFAADGKRVLFIGSDPADLTRSDIYMAGDSGVPVKLTDQPVHKTNVMVDPSGAALVYSPTATAPFRLPAPAGQPAGGRGNRGGGGGGAGGGAGAAGAGAAAAVAPAPNPCGGGGGGRGGGGTVPSFAVVDLQARTTRAVNGSAVTMSADGTTLAWLLRSTDTCAIVTAPTLSENTTTVRLGRERVDAPALSPDGKLVVYQMMPFTDWELFVTDRSGATRRVTHEIQHDILPRFLTNTTLLGLIGEPRHRRSQVYDLATMARTRVFANNTIRTISPEYIWLTSADGSRLLIQAERDGDTISVERGVYVVDLRKKVTVADLTARIDRQLSAENDLRQRMTSVFQPIAPAVRDVVSGVSAARAYEYGKAQFDFDSKHVSQPGNAKAIDYLNRTYASFGYTPELQWFQPQQALGNRTANIVSTLTGTTDPSLIYVVSSHFDSVAVGPGADDDTSGTCALLETARVLAGHPLPATVVFASFTGEEAGLLGSREFVRLAAERKWKIVGALNNDMIGWAAESARMDNTIRYSNAGIRDLQHGAAFLFSNLITYDAKYYKGTDANAFYDGWGDIVGGIGSYPVLGNPNYHQPTDTLETINFHQVVETAKVTAATLMYLASSPSRLKGLAAAKAGTGVEVTWTPSPEKGVQSYIVAYGPPSDPLKNRMTVTAARATLPAVPAGAAIAVKAVNSRGLEGWDWARVLVQQ